MQVKTEVIILSALFNHCRELANEFIEKSLIKPGSLVVIGCSTSEVSGKRIGSAGSLEIARDIFTGLNEVFSQNGVNVCAQCCEHLNRALIIERSVAQSNGFEIVSVVPHEHAGGSFATAAYSLMNDPVAVEEVRADAGIDIGLTLIGMHLKKVAVPLRLENNMVGEALVTAARTRPKFIGGARAKYE
ncbi:MAG: TIGR01440 family protein [Clostridiales bacterium]|nr:TIGR01440 family protein [Clostridiales bacterium]